MTSKPHHSQKISFAMTQSTLSEGMEIVVRLTPLTPSRATMT